MSDKINFFTAILGLVASIIALKGIFKEKKTNSVKSKTVDTLEGFKKTFNAVGSIVLVMALYFGYMIMMMAFPSIMTYVTNIGKAKQVEIDNNIIPYEKIRTHSEIVFYSAKSLYSNTNKDKQLDLLIEKSLSDKEYELVLNIIKSYSSNSKKEKAIDVAFEHFLRNKEYLYALMVSDLYSSTLKNDNQKIKIINGIFDYKNEDNDTDEKNN